MRFGVQLLEIVGRGLRSGRKSKHWRFALVSRSENFPDLPCAESLLFTEAEGRSDGWLRKHQAVADSEIEGVPEIPLFDSAVGLKPGEQIWTWPAVPIHPGDRALRQAARQVLGNPSTRDVSHRMNRSV